MTTRSGTVNDIVRQVLVIAAVVGVIVVNALANILPLNGQTTGAISDRFDVYFVPAGYVFSIWSLIYLGLIGYAVFQALPRQRTNPRLRAIGYPFVASCLANIAWIFLWHYEHFAWTLVAMVTLLVVLGCLLGFVWVSALLVLGPTALLAAVHLGKDWLTGLIS